jgi:hypothetical protein
MGSKIQLCSFLTSELDEDEWSGSRPWLFVPGKTLAVLTVFHRRPTTWFDPKEKRGLRPMSGNERRFVGRTIRRICLFATIGALPTDYSLYVLQWWVLKITFPYIYYIRIHDSAFLRYLLRIKILRLYNTLKTCYYFVMHSRKYTGTRVRNGSLTTASVLQCPTSP